MARIKKIVSDINIRGQHVFLEDPEADSKYFRINELHETLTGGKNAFLIAGTEFLELGTDVLAELIDSTGNTIYVEPGEGIPEYYEGVSKIVSMHIYEDTPFGPANLTVLGELKTYIDENGIERFVPDEWKGKYNVRWTRRLNINPRERNTTKIRFVKRPVLNITEVRKPVYNRIISGSTLNVDAIHGESAIPNAGINFLTYTGESEYRLELTRFDTAWSASMVGETITVTGLDQSYTPTIKSVINEKVAIASAPYFVTNEPGTQQVITDFTSASFSITHTFETDKVATPLTSSFAQINITRLETFAGDVNRIKLFRKSFNRPSSFELIQDAELEAEEILIDASSLNLEERVGYFFAQSTIDSFWSSSNVDTSVAPITTTFSRDFIIDSVLLEGDDAPNFDDEPRYKFQNTDTVLLDEGSEYTLTFNVGFTRVAVSTPAKMEVYISGSGIPNDGGNEDHDFGRLISTVETTDQTITSQKFSFEENFAVDTTVNASLIFVSYYADWYMSDISLRASFETSFSPNVVNFIVPTPTDILNENFKFKAEFFDVNSNKVPILVESPIIPFSGSNFILLGPDGNPIVEQFRLDYSSNITTLQLDETGSITSPPGSSVGIFAFEGDKLMTVGSISNPLGGPYQINDSRRANELNPGEYVILSSSLSHVGHDASVLNMNQPIPGIASGSQLGGGNVTQTIISMSLNNTELLPNQTTNDLFYATDQGHIGFKVIFKRFSNVTGSYTGSDSRIDWIKQLPEAFSPWTASQDTVPPNVSTPIEFVGIGNDDPKVGLHITSGSGAAIRLESTGVGRSWDITNNYNDLFVIFNRTAGTYPFYIDNAGNVTIGPIYTGFIRVDQIDIDNGSITCTSGDLTINSAGNVLIPENITITGAVGISGYLTVDNINIDTNTIVSLNTNGDIYLEPNGAGITTIKNGTSEALRIQDDAADGSPYISFYQTSNRRGFLGFNDTTNMMQLASKYGPIHLYTGTAGSEAIRFTAYADGSGVNIATGGLFVASTEVITSARAITGTFLTIDQVTIDGNTISSTSGQTLYINSNTGPVVINDPDGLQMGVGTSTIDYKIYFDGFGSDFTIGNNISDGAFNMELGTVITNTPEFEFDFTSGFGLGMSAGYGLSTDGNGQYLAWKLLQSGTWNMDSTPSVNVAHGLTWTDIRLVFAIIRNNATETTRYDLQGDNNGSIQINSTNIVLVRTTGGTFDNTSFNDTINPRAYVMVGYIP